MIITISFQKFVLFSNICIIHGKQAQFRNFSRVQAEFCRSSSNFRDCIKRIRSPKTPNPVFFGDFDDLDAKITVFSQNSKNLRKFRRRCPIDTNPDQSPLIDD